MLILRVSIIQRVFVGDQRCILATFKPQWYNKPLERVCTTHTAGIRQIKTPTPSVFCESTHTTASWRAQSWVDVGQHMAIAYHRLSSILAHQHFRNAALLSASQLLYHDYFYCLCDTFIVCSETSNDVTVCKVTQLVWLQHTWQYSFLLLPLPFQCSCIWLALNSFSV